MSVIELSDEETVAILTETFIESLADLGDKTRQVAVLKRIHALLDSSAPQHFIYETVQGCDELQVIHLGGDRRIYYKLVMGVPAGDEHYNVLLVFYADPDDYDAPAVLQSLTRSDGWQTGVNRYHRLTSEECQT